MEQHVDNKYEQSVCLIWPQTNVVNIADLMCYQVVNRRDNPVNDCSL